MGKYYQWVKNLIIGISFSSLSILLLNYTVDKFNFFNQSNNNIIKDLHEGYYISGDTISINRVDNIYEGLIKNIDSIDVLAIGSSKTILLHKKLLFNSSSLK